MSIDLNTLQGPKSIYQPPSRVATPYPYTDDDDGSTSSSSDIVLPWPDKYPPRPYLTEVVDRTIAAADAGKRGIVEWHSVKRKFQITKDLRHESPGLFRASFYIKTR